MDGIIEFEKLCRLCASNTETFSQRSDIFDSHGNRQALLDKIEENLRIRISFEDRLPKTVCYGCVCTLEMFDVFRQKCLNSQQILLDNLHILNGDTISDARRRCEVQLIMVPYSAIEPQLEQRKELTENERYERDSSTNDFDEEEEDFEETEVMEVDEDGNDSVNDSPEELVVEREEEIELASDEDADGVEVISDETDSHVINSRELSQEEANTHEVDDLAASANSASKEDDDITILEDQYENSVKQVASLLVREYLETQSKETQESVEPQKNVKVEFTQILDTAPEILPEPKYGSPEYEYGSHTPKWDKQLNPEEEQSIPNEDQIVNSGSGTYLQQEVRFPGGLVIQSYSDSSVKDIENRRVSSSEVPKKPATPPKKRFYNFEQENRNQVNEIEYVNVTGNRATINTKTHNVSVNPDSSVPEIYIRHVPTKDEDSSKVGGNSVSPLKNSTSKSDLDISQKGYESSEIKKETSNERSLFRSENDFLASTPKARAKKSFMTFESSPIRVPNDVKAEETYDGERSPVREEKERDDDISSSIAARRTPRKVSSVYGLYGCKCCLDNWGSKVVSRKHTDEVYSDWRCSKKMKREMQKKNYVCNGVKTPKKKRNEKLSEQVEVHETVEGISFGVEPVKSAAEQMETCELKAKNMGDMSSIQSKTTNHGSSATENDVSLTGIKPKEPNEVQKDFPNSISTHDEDGKEIAMSDVRNDPEKPHDSVNGIENDSAITKYQVEEHHYNDSSLPVDTNIASSTGENTTKENVTPSDVQEEQLSTNNITSAATNVPHSILKTKNHPEEANGECDLNPSSQKESDMCEVQTDPNNVTSKKSIGESNREVVPTSTKCDPSTVRKSSRSKEHKNSVKPDVPEEKIKKRVRIQENKSSCVENGVDLAVVKNEVNQETESPVTFEVQNNNSNFTVDTKLNESVSLPSNMSEFQHVLKQCSVVITKSNSQVSPEVGRPIKKRIDKVKKKIGDKVKKKSEKISGGGPVIKHKKKPRAVNRALETPEGEVCIVKDKTCSVVVESHTNCENSESVEQDESVVKAHVSKKGVNFMCEICGKGFRLKDHYKHHMKSHQLRNPLPCSICKKIFFDAEKLEEHSKIHEDMKLHQCDICGKCYSYAVGLEDHMQVHLGAKPYKCDSCNRAYTYKSSLLIHRATSKDCRKKFPCEKCSEHFQTADELKDHCKKHGKEQIICNVCNKTFATYHILIAHKSVHRKNASGKLFVCEFCDQEFVKHKAYMKHIKTHTPDSLNQCTICGKQFESEKNLQLHMRNHACEEIGGEVS